MKKETTLTLPTIHMNGTSAKDLREKYLDARNAMEAAKDALAAIEFNARDYYPQGDQAFGKAREEMAERFRMLSKMSDDLMAITIHVDQFVK